MKTSWEVINRSQTRRIIPEHVSPKEHLSRLLPLSKSFRYKLDPFRSSFSDEEYRHSSEKSVRRSLIATTKRDFFGWSIRKWWINIFLEWENDQNVFEQCILQSLKSRFIQMTATALMIVLKQTVIRKRRRKQLSDLKSISAKVTDSVCRWNTFPTLQLQNYRNTYLQRNKLFHFRSISGTEKRLCRMSLLHQKRTYFRQKKQKNVESKSEVQERTGKYMTRKC